MSTVIPFPQRPADTTQTGDDGTCTGRTAPVVRAVYTVAETAEILSLSLGSTYALVRSGEIPAMKLGGRWLIPKRRLHQWLDDLPDTLADDTAGGRRRHRHQRDA
ncbi:DNA binding domain-containing protein, excisionase family [Micromonospora nigra]|uniref:DNA binding domain-containing protein, excisionase family n=1 Tax=Micromonospora nigra TaxID=145857 RepID=A0A1C6S0F2_9ACTN|nr:helix-turn-helix domain-containing protein [Micromonospora nigra]SCL22832.1 DNA binding domain-containing protein, excisionase family [Micromonospora nigra]